VNGIKNPNTIHKSILWGYLDSWNLFKTDPHDHVTQDPVPKNQFCGLWEVKSLHTANCYRSFPPEVLNNKQNYKTWLFSLEKGQCSWMQEKESSLSNISCSFIRLVWTHNTVSSVSVNWFPCTPVFIKFDFYLQHISAARKRLRSLFLRANSSWFCYDIYNFFTCTLTTCIVQGAHISNLHPPGIYQDILTINAHTCSP